MQVFLSYRRSDVGGYAGRLTDALTRQLGRRNVFHDVTAIGPGQDYVVAIDRALGACDVVLAVIGPGWLSATPPSGTPRLFEPDDVVRLELSRALAGNAPVVPVLVGQARLPAAEDLPEDLRPLAQRQAVTLHDETWHEDARGLIRSLRGAPAAPAGSRRTWVAGVLAIVVLLAGGASVVRWWAADRQGPTDPRGGTSTGESADPACPATSGPGWTTVPLAPDPSAEMTVDEGSVTFTVLAGHWRPQGSGWQVVLVIAMENRTSGEVYHYAGRYAGLEVAKRRSAQPSCFTVDDAPFRPGTVQEAVAGFDVGCRPVGRLNLALADETRIVVSGAGLEPGPC